MVKLGVNVDHVATIRQARQTDEPDPVWAAVLAELGGADLITVHLREDRRHIQDRDVRLLTDTVAVPLNLEMAMVEAEKSVSAGGTDSILGANSGTEGLFKAVESRGIVATNAFDAVGDVISDFDLILKELDKQGSIEENMLFLNRDANLKMDDALANISAGSAGGTAFGVFENSEDMALNLGFRGFRRGSYDFYKTDWKYLNNKSTRGLFADIKGIMVPAGTSSVYDQIMGKNIRRPFLHVRYRASEADDRRMKSWITGSVGGAATSGDDKMEVHYLSERCLVTQAANNFVLFK